MNPFITNLVNPELQQKTLMKILNLHRLYAHEHMDSNVPSAEVEKDSKRVSTGELVQNVYDSNLVSSKVKGNRYMHRPMLDLDFPCTLVESSTPGHYHLYMDIQIDWEAYKEALVGLYRAGILEEGFYKLALSRGMTMLRRPGIKKGASNANYR